MAEFVIERWGAKERERVIEDLQSLIAAVGKKYGISIEYAGGSYDDTTLRVRLEARVTSGAGAEMRAKMDKMSAAALGLPEDVIGKKFLFGRRMYQVTALNLNRPKYPISAKRLPDGKAFKFPASAFIHGHELVRG